MDLLDEKKRRLVVNVIKFLQEDVGKDSLSDDKKESIEVAIQCLETAYDVNDDIKKQVETEGFTNLVALLPETPIKADVSEEAKAEANECKNKGNQAMKNSQYNIAVDEYTKAIQLNPNNAVYFCNRAAAYSRLEKHYDAINDCKQAIRLDPTYGKAYGRLGIAYSNLNMYEDAREAYKTAIRYDPGNSIYETNLKLAEERMMTNMDSAAPPQHRPIDIAQFINNPALINMATQMLSDPSFRNMMSGLMGNPGDPDFDALFQAGQTLANRMNTADPNFVESFRRAVNEQNVPGLNVENSSENQPQDGSNPSDKKDS